MISECFNQDEPPPLPLKVPYRFYFVNNNVAKTHVLLLLLAF